VPLVKDFQNKTHKLNYLFHTYPSFYPKKHYYLFTTFIPSNLSKCYKTTQHWFGHMKENFLKKSKTFTAFSQWNVKYLQTNFVQHIFRFFLFFKNKLHVSSLCGPFFFTCFTKENFKFLLFYMFCCFANFESITSIIKVKISTIIIVFTIQ